MKRIYIPPADEVCYTCGQTKPRNKECGAVICSICHPMKSTERVRQARHGPEKSCSQPPRGTLAIALKGRPLGAINRGGR